MIVPSLRAQRSNPERRKRRLDCFAAALLAMAMATLFGINTAHAHPDVWVSSASELIYAVDGSITAVRHAWTFDDAYSTSTLEGIESKTKGVFTREELAPLAQLNVASLKEFGFFTFAVADGKKQKFLEPVDYYLEYKAPAPGAAFHAAIQDTVDDEATKTRSLRPDQFRGVFPAAGEPCHVGRRADVLQTRRATAGSWLDETATRRADEGSRTFQPGRGVYQPDHSGLSVSALFLDIMRPTREATKS
jgi:hypothetical protein